jgi:hypothetical protein
LPLGVSPSGEALLNVSLKYHSSIILIMSDKVTKTIVAAFTGFTALFSGIYIGERNIFFTKKQDTLIYEREVELIKMKNQMELNKEKE